MDLLILIHLSLVHAELLITDVPDNRFCSASPGLASGKTSIFSGDEGPLDALDPQHGKRKDPHPHPPCVSTTSLFQSTLQSQEFPDSINVGNRIPQNAVMYFIIKSYEL